MTLRGLMSWLRAVANPSLAGRSVSLLCILGSGLPISAASAKDAIFDVVSIPNTGRSVAARIADFNGDQRADLMVVAVEGMPPSEQRLIRVFLQHEDGSLPTAPSHTLALPPRSGVYDLADVVAWPGVEMVLLRHDGVSLLSLADETGKRLDLPVGASGSIATSEDERGFEAFKLVYDDFGPEPWILVPQFGRLLALSVDGSVEASLDVGRRSNYYVVPSSGLISAESDIQLFIDVPKLSVGDVDGDGRIDIVSSTRHEIRVFLRREDGSFASTSDRSIPLGLVTRRDHIRGSGGVACEFRDFNADGKLDLLITHVEGSVTNATTTTYVFVNRDGHWNLDAPDGTFTSTDALASNVLVDIDRDGALELLRIKIKFSLLEFIELLLTREVDAEIAIHRQESDASFAEVPLLTRKFGIPFSFETFRATGFVPTIAADLNRDGHVDLLTSGAGDEVEVFLGGGDSPFSRRNARQKMSTAGVIEFADFDGDGLTDFVLFDPHNFDVPVQVAINTGALGGKGTPSLRSREASNPPPGADPARVEAPADGTESSESPAAE